MKKFIWQRWISKWISIWIFSFVTYRYQGPVSRYLIVVSQRHDAVKETLGISRFTISKLLSGEIYYVYQSNCSVLILLSMSFFCWFFSFIHDQVFICIYIYIEKQGDIYYCFRYKWNSDTENYFSISDLLVSINPFAFIFNSTYIFWLLYLEIYLVAVEISFKCD